jgi:hypothetical protein
MGLSGKEQVSLLHKTMTDILSWISLSPSCVSALVQMAFPVLVLRPCSLNLIML